MIRRPPRSTLTDKLFPYPTLFLSTAAIPYRSASAPRWYRAPRAGPVPPAPARSEEHTSELQSLMRISYAVFCLKKKKKTQHTIKCTNHRQHRERYYKNSYDMNLTRDRDTQTIHQLITR